MNLLIIFTRNPELGKVKTRLAASIGTQKALNIYTFLVEHTASITRELSVHKQVHYSVQVHENDIWDNSRFEKRLQQGADLGARMEFAFTQGFSEGYRRIVIVGSDMFDIQTSDIEEAFRALEDHNFVIGPAEDGGYYLLGMTALKSELFRKKAWGTNTVYQDTLADLKAESLYTLTVKNDIDVYDDIKDIPEFRRFLGEP